MLWRRRICNEYRKEFTMKKIRTYCAAAAALALAGTTLFTGCGNNTDNTADEKTKITFCLDWTPNTNHTGLYVAQQMGYYEEAGLEVEIVQPPENGATLMCASGQAQFAIEAQDTMAASLALDEPLEVTAVAALIQHNTSGIISRAGDGIDSPAGMCGKTYSTWESPIELAMLESVITTDGGNYDEVTLIPNNITDEPAALAANQTDAIWVFYGWGVINAEVEGVDVDFFAFSDIDSVFDYYTPVIIGNNEYLEEHPDVAKAFLEATMKGYAYAIENPEAAADMLISGDTTGSLKDSRDLVVKSQEYLAKEYVSDAAKWGYIDADRWNAFYGWLYEKGLIDKDLTGIGFCNDYLPE